MENENSTSKKLAGLEKEIIYKKVLGSLLGVAYGDAMGMPTSLMNPVEIKKIFPQRIIKLLPAPKGHFIHNGLIAGEITDDTQQTLLLADLFIEEKKFSRQGVAKKLLDWAKSLNAFESMLLGPSSMRALKMIDEGVPLEETGRLGDTNGAAMKISPVGIVHPGDYDAVIKDVAEVCVPTHNTNIAIAGGSGVACAVSSAMVNNDLFHLMEAFYYGIEEGMKLGNQWYGASIQKRTELALKIILTGKREVEIWQDLYDYVGAGVAMSESVPTALALVVYYHGNPLKTAEAAANMGGDCDTVGAIAGGIAGAYSGYEVFPNEIIDQLSSVNKVDFHSYARKLTDAIFSS
ncbi:MAG: ADP-ribosylglycohydrolase family protein [Melioribacteraceae bacterium]|nr:ADP-ribosylglycohydrolase family protein [Melioribacteraceae bacterium]